jgi:tetrahydromethanopterin S-methyltransferase subunit A
VEADQDPARLQALQAIREQLALGTAAAKCHRCGCLQQTVEALAGTEAGQTELAESLDAARNVFVPTEYDCLGCPICFPAIAANLFSGAFPVEGDGMDLCPTEEPDERAGWPPRPGDFYVLRYQAPVAVCTLNSADLASRLNDRSPAGLAIVGTMHTENLGIERLIQNVVANPHIRFLILCGLDTEQAIGHLPGQSLTSLWENGVDDRGRIIGARGKRPILKNVSPEHIDVFRRQVRLVSLIGETDADAIAAAVGHHAAGEVEPFVGAPVAEPVVTVQAKLPDRLIMDPAGFFVVYPDSARQRLFLEHYTKAGVLDQIVEGTNPSALYATAVQLNLVTRLDHAAYLGQELARAACCLEAGTPYVQDRAPEVAAPDIEASASSCGCAPSTQCSPGGRS